MSTPELILTNGKVFSVTMSDEVIRGEAVAIADGKIAAVGSSDEICALAAEDTKIIDCHGNTILPGLSDVHCHIVDGATEAAGVDLFGIYMDETHTAEDVIKEIKTRVKKYAEAHPGAAIIRGAGWVDQFTPSDRHPTRQDLDEVCPDIPVALSSFCHHHIWVNTKALEHAGIDASTPDPSTGDFGREENGYPTGVFNDVEAVQLLQSRLPEYPMTKDEIKDAFLKYQDTALSYGLTLVCDCLCSPEGMEAAKELAREGKLKMRLRGVYHLKPDNKDELGEFIARKGSDNVGDDYRVDTVKMFAEGTFAMIDGYDPDFCAQNGLPPDYNGELYWKDEDFAKIVSRSMEAGFNVHVHAMGNAAVAQSARCIAAGQQKIGRKGRNVIAHNMIVPDETAKLMGEENIIANVQLCWMMLENDVESAKALIGDLAYESYPYRKFLEHGVVTASGTDFPVNSQSTIQSMAAGMTRRALPDVPGYEKFKDHQLGCEKPATLAECIKTMTIGSAYQCFAEERTGSIEIGKSADLVIMDADLESMEPLKICEAHVAATIFKGEVVYER